MIRDSYSDQDGGRACGCKDRRASTTNQQKNNKHLNGKERTYLIMRKDPAKFDALVARYYPAVYDFAVKLTEDPRVAVGLTRAAFRNAQSQLSRMTNKSAIATILISSVLRAGLQVA